MATLSERALARISRSTKKRFVKSVKADKYPVSVRAILLSPIRRYVVGYDFGMGYVGCYSEASSLLARTVTLSATPKSVFLGPAIIPLVTMT